MKFDIGDHETRDGREARVHFVLSSPTASKCPLIGELKNDDGKWYSFSWSQDGKAYPQSPPACLSDLKAPGEECWMNVTEPGIRMYYDSEKSACEEAAAGVTMPSGQRTGASFVRIAVHLKERDE